MLLKIATALVIFGVIWLVFFRLQKAVGAARGASPERPERIKAQDLTKCPACGIYLPAGGSCDCTQRS